MYIYIYIGYLNCSFGCHPQMLERLITQLLGGGSCEGNLERSMVKEKCSLRRNTLKVFDTLATLCICTRNSGCPDLSLSSFSSVITSKCCDRTTIQARTVPFVSFLIGCSSTYRSSLHNLQYRQRR